MPDDLVTRPEHPSDAEAIDALVRIAFGPGAYARAAFRVREQAPHSPDLSFVSELDGKLIGAVRLTPIRLGSSRGLLLGPLVVDPGFKNLGYGKNLVRHAVEAARSAGCAYVILVGDAPYYKPLGFAPMPGRSVRMPGPVDPARLLIAELQPGAAQGLAGTITGVRT